jgi:hypothetical protein
MADGWTQVAFPEVVDTRCSGPGRVDQSGNGRWVDPCGVSRGRRAGWADPGGVTAVEIGDGTVAGEVARGGNAGWVSPGWISARAVHNWDRSRQRAGGNQTS